MSAFKKATVDQSKLRVAFYGPPGAGKTFTSLLVAEGLAEREKKRIAVIDTEESGTSFYAIAVESRQVHPEAFDFDVLKTQSLAEMIEAVEGLDLEKYGVIVMDSMTHAWQAAQEAYEGRRTKADTIPLHGKYDGNRVKVLSPSAVFAEAIRQIHYSATMTITRH